MVSVEQTINLGNYQFEKIRLDIQLTDNDKVSDAVYVARKTIRAQYQNKKKEVPVEN